jgi:hypothetical protein
MGLNIDAVLPRIICTPDDFFVCAGSALTGCLKALLRSTGGAVFRIAVCFPVLKRLSAVFIRAVVLDVAGCGNFFPSRLSKANRRFVVVKSCMTLPFMPASLRK